MMPKDVQSLMDKLEQALQWLILKFSNKETQL